MKLWQLKNLKTGESLSEPQHLPENWGPIFGLHNVKDRLGDLSWVGITDKGWFEVEVAEPVIDVKASVDDQIAHLLKESLPMVAADNLSMSKIKRQEWINYRKQLQEIPLQAGYPSEIYWPGRPE